MSKTRYISEQSAAASLARDAGSALRIVAGIDTGCR
jgi:hypothetical protein